jgi:hypothetical protein
VKTYAYAYAYASRLAVSPHDLAVDALPWFAEE